MAHGMWRNQNEAPELDEEVRGILAGVVSNRMGYQPTTQVIVGEFDTIDEEYLKRPPLAEVYPARLIEWYASTQYKNPVQREIPTLGQKPACRERSAAGPR
jgi:hypothetical protein